MAKAAGLEFKVGLFSLVAIAVIGYMFFVLTPGMLDRQKQATYYTIFPDAAGIQPRTQVKTNGVIIGKVRAVELGDNVTKIVMEFRSDIKIPVGTTVEVRTRGLLGDVYVEIKRVNDNGTYIEEGGLIPRTENATDMASIMSAVGSIAADVKKITGTLANVMGNQDAETKLKNIVDDIAGITSGLRGTIAENRSDLKAVLANLREVSDGLKTVLNKDNQEKFNRIVASFDTSMEEVKGATKNIRLISDKIEKGEGTIGKLVNDDSTINEIQGAIREIREVISPANKLQIGVDYHGELRKEDGVQNYFNLVFKTNPDRYYILGATDKDNEVTDTTTETYEDTPAAGSQPGTKRTRETSRTSKSLAFNLQFAKRWYNAAIRFGLFESTGGIGADYFILRDKVRFAFEAFDWKSKDNNIRRTAHIKAYASVLFFNHISMMVGLDDMTRLDVTTGKANPVGNYFIGAGVAFNDSDLKALFGAAALAR